MTKPFSLTKRTVCSVFAAGIVLVAGRANAQSLAKPKQQNMGGSMFTWQAKSGRTVQLARPRLTIEDPNGKPKQPLTIEPKSHCTKHNETILRYNVSFASKGHKIDGDLQVKAKLLEEPEENVLLCNIDLKFAEPVKEDILAQHVCKLPQLSLELHLSSHKA